MNAFDDLSWQARSYQDLMDETIRLELQHAGLPENEGGAVRARLEKVVMSCSYLRRPEFSGFAGFYRPTCSPRKMHPSTVEAFLRAAWKACDDDAGGVRPIPGKAENAARARELRRSFIFDTEESWAYEGLDVKFRADLLEGEEPAILSSAGNQQPEPTLSIAELEEGMREYIDSGELEAKFAGVAAAFDEKQLLTVSGQVIPSM